MTDILLPVSIDVASVSFRVMDSVGVSRNPLTGAVRTASRGGDKLGATIEYSPTGGMSATAKQKQRILRAHVAQIMRSNRCYLYDPGYSPQGSFPATELFTNSDLNGVTGWTVQAGTLSAGDRNLRVTPSASSGSQPGVYQSVSLTQYVPYAVRSMAGLVTSRASNLSPFYSDGVVGASSASTGMALRRIAFVPPSTGSVNLFPIYNSDAAWDISDAIDLHFASASRCLIADASPNNLTFSDQIDNAAWTKSGILSTAANSSSQTDPWGTTTAEKITENTSNVQHYVLQSGPTVATVADYCGVIYARRDTLARDVMVTVGTTGSGHYGQCTFDLGAGTAGSAVVGGSATNARAYIKALGNSWYACYVVVRLPTAATRADVQANMISGGASTYTGTTGTLMLVRGGVSQSSLPFLPGLTTTVGASGTSQSGSRLFVKGGPASVSGSLAMGDWIEVTTSLGPQLTMVTASVDFDAAMLGVINVSPAIRGTVADGAAIIVNRPMGRFIPSQGGEWRNDPGIFTMATAVEFEEAPA